MKIESLFEEFLRAKVAQNELEAAASPGSRLDLEEMVESLKRKIKGTFELSILHYNLAFGYADQMSEAHRAHYTSILNELLGSPDEEVLESVIATMPQLAGYLVDDPGLELVLEKLNALEAYPGIEEAKEAVKQMMQVKGKPAVALHGAPGAPERIFTLLDASHSLSMEVRMYSEFNELVWRTDYMNLAEFSFTLFHGDGEAKKEEKGRFSVPDGAEFAEARVTLPREAQTVQMEFPYLLWRSNCAV